MLHFLNQTCKKPPRATPKAGIGNQVGGWVGKSQKASTPAALAGAWHRFTQLEDLGSSASTWEEAC